MDTDLPTPDTRDDARGHQGDETRRCESDQFSRRTGHDQDNERTHNHCQDRNDQHVTLVDLCAVPVADLRSASRSATPVSVTTPRVSTYFGIRTNTGISRSIRSAYRS